MLPRSGQVNTFGDTIYFAVDGTFRKALSITQETSIEQRNPDSKSPDYNTIRSWVKLMGYLFFEEFEFDLTRRLQSDQIKHRFSSVAPWVVVDFL